MHPSPLSNSRTFCLYRKRLRSHSPFPLPLATGNPSSTVHGFACSKRFMKIELWDMWPLTSLVFHLFSCSAVSGSLRPRGLHHARLPCPSLSPGICSNACLWSQRCYPTISSSVAFFSSCPQSFPASGSFPVSRLFTSGGPKYWSFNISPSDEYSGLISFRTN